MPIGSKITDVAVGDFQLMVLRAVAALGSEAYGVAIREALEKSMKREVHIPQVYVALRQLEKRQLVSSSIDNDASAGLRGRPRRCYQLVARGKRTLAAGVGSPKVPDRVKVNAQAGKAATA